MTALAVDQSGNVYATGFYENAMNFDPLGSGDGSVIWRGDRDCYLVSYKPDGTFRWVRTWGSPNREWGWDVIVSPAQDQSVYVCGQLVGTVDFGDTFSVTVDTQAGFLAKFSSGTTPQCQWAKAWESCSNYPQNQIYASGVAASQDGLSIYVSGMYRGGCCDLNPTGGYNPYTSVGPQDSYVTGISSNGNTWLGCNTWGGASSDTWAMGIGVDADGNVYVTGVFTDTCYFGPWSRTSTASPGYNGYLLKLNSGMAFTDGWVHQLADATSPMWPSDVNVYADSVYVGGHFQGTGFFDYDGGGDPHASNGGLDGFVTRFLNTGQYQWTRTYGWTGGDGVEEIEAGIDGYVYLVGYFSGLIEINPDDAVYDFRSSNGGQDTFVSKITSNGYWE
jgi:hypothetical protein